MDVTSWLLDGAKEYSTSKRVLGMEEPQPIYLPQLSCAICGDWAGEGICHSKDEIEATVSELNKKALCPDHHRNWRSYHSNLTIAEYLEKHQ